MPAAAERAPSPLLDEHAERLARAATLGPVVELACGRGRIACHVAAKGVPVVGVDRNAEHLAELGARARAEHLPVTRVRCDLESGHGLPLPPGRCGALLIFRYLHRPLAREIAHALAPGGLLLYETFTLDQRDLGYGPRNPAFLLEAGELPQLFPGLRGLSHQEGVREGARGGARPEAVASFAAVRPG